MRRSVAVCRRRIMGSSGISRVTRNMVIPDFLKWTSAVSDDDEDDDDYHVSMYNAAEFF